MHPEYDAMKARHLLNAGSLAAPSLAALVAIALLAGASAARADIQGLTRVASGLAAPIFMDHAPNDPSRLFIAERGGSIRILDLGTGTVLPTPFLTTTVDTAGEGGLLGLAFHPDYSSVGAPGFGKFYVNSDDWLAVHDAHSRVL